MGRRRCASARALVGEDVQMVGKIQLPKPQMKHLQVRIDLNIPVFNLFGGCCGGRHGPEHGRLQHVPLKSRASMENVMSFANIDTAEIENLPCNYANVDDEDAPVQCRQCQAELATSKSVYMGF